MTSTHDGSQADPQTVLEAVRSLCRTAEYKVPGRHETWDSYHEGRSSFADEVEQIVDRVKAPDAEEPDRVSAALNRAADEVLSLAGREDDRLVDAVNLVVNAALHYVDHPDGDLDDAIEANYSDADADECCERSIAQTVRGWLTD